MRNAEVSEKISNFSDDVIHVCHVARSPRRYNVL